MWAINLFRFSLVVLMNDYHFLPEGVENHTSALKEEKKSFSFKREDSSCNPYINLYNEEIHIL